MSFIAMLFFAAPPRAPLGASLALRLFNPTFLYALWHSHNVTTNGLIHAFHRRPVSILMSSFTNVLLLLLLAVFLLISSSHP